MTINNAEAFLAGIWDWGILRGRFGETKIEPTDIDGFVERNGQFLVLEAKAPGVSVKDGQQIAFDRLLSTGKFTIIVVWGSTNNPERLRVYTQKRKWDYKTADLDTLRGIVSWWFRKTDKDTRLYGPYKQGVN